MEIFKAICERRDLRPMITPEFILSVIRDGDFNADEPAIVPPERDIHDILEEINIKIDKLDSKMAEFEKKEIKIEDVVPVDERVPQGLNEKDAEEYIKNKKKPSKSKRTPKTEEIIISDVTIDVKDAVPFEEVTESGENTLNDCTTLNEDAEKAEETVKEEHGEACCDCDAPQVSETKNTCWLVRLFKKILSLFSFGD